jgi:hypothetical protein
MEGDLYVPDVVVDDAQSRERDVTLDSVSVDCLVDFFRFPFAKFGTFLLEHATTVDFAFHFSSPTSVEVLYLGDPFFDGLVRTLF